MDNWNQLRIYLLKLWQDNLPKENDFTPEQWTQWVEDENPDLEWPTKKEVTLLDAILCKMKEIEDK